MANGNVTATTAAKFINDVWSPELNRAIEYYLGIEPLFKDRTKQATANGGGQVFHLPARHNLTANTKSAGSAATPENITETEQTFTPSTHQITAQEIESFAEVMSMYDIRNEYSLAAAYSLARARDIACGLLFDDNTSQVVGILGSENTEDNILAAWTYIQNAGAKGPYQGVTSPAGYAGMLKINNFVNSQWNGDTQGKAVREAQVGKTYQATWFTSQLLTGTAPQAYGHIWADDHFFKITKKPPTQDAWLSPLDKAWVVATDQIYGVFEKQEADEAAAVTTTARLWGVAVKTLK